MNKLDVCSAKGALGNRRKEISGYQGWKQRIHGIATEKWGSAIKRDVLKTCAM